MSFVPMYDLESLTEAQRQEYVKNVCAHMGVPDNLNLVMLTYLDDGEGPRRLVAYAKRGAAEIIRNSKGINVTNVVKDFVGGSIMFTVTGQDSKGHQEIAVGSKWIKDLAGQDLDDAIMTANTRALRRMTLQFVGAGVLDESEVNPSQPVIVKNTTAVAVPPQPTAQVNLEPGKDITEATAVFQTTQVPPVTLPPNSGSVLQVVPAPVGPFDETPEQFKARMEKLRADAIASLNAKELSVPVSATEAEAKNNVGTEEPKKRRTRKPRVDMGPSVPPPVTASSQIKPPEPEPQPVLQGVVNPLPLVGAPVLAVTDVGHLPEAITRPPASKSKLSPEQVKPYRQRLFKLVNDHLEPNEFAPKENMGNSDKMRAFATMMFPEIGSMNELSVEQWEKYLTVLENKVKSEGAKATGKYIEDSIGL